MKLAPCVIAACFLLPAIATAQLHALRIATGLTTPVGYYPDPLDAAKAYVVQLDGRIRTLRGQNLRGDFLTIPASELASRSEQGLLGMAFHPNYATNRFVYVYFTRKDRALCVARFTVSGGKADYTTRHNVIAIPHPVHDNHNGGTIRFGEDGYLYLATGDGGSGNDPNGNAQNLNSMLGKMLRIDVDRDAFANTNKNYAIPPGNPFAGAVPGLAEIWAYGLRNPYKWSFDTNGDIYIADVGQAQREEVNRIPAGASGLNFGWRAREGTLDNPSVPDPEPANHVLPIFEYGRLDGKSIIGGHVYHGVKLGAEYKGRYFFADYITAKIWSIDPMATDVAASRIDHTLDLGSTIKVSSIDLNINNELVICDLRGQIYRVRRDP